MSVANQLVYANRQYRAHFVQELESGRAEWEPFLKALMMEFGSTGKGISHSFTDALKGLEEWIDDREMTKLGEQTFFVENKSYAGGVEIDRDDLEDDLLGQLIHRIRDLATKYWLHRIKELETLLNAGYLTTIWDGKKFFANDHVLADSDSVNDNLANLAMSEENVKTVITQLKNMKDSQGELLKLRPTHLLYGNDLEWTAEDILKQARQASGEDNVLRGKMQSLQLSGMDATTWAVVDLSRTLKPFMFQNRRKPQFTEVTNPESEEVFKRKKFMWGTDYRGRSFYAFYQTMVWSAGS